MLKNLLTVAVRNLLRHKLYTAVNVLGLAIGLAGAILILLYVKQEFSVDRFYTLGDRIYKVIREVRKTTRTTYESGTSGALGPELEASFPEVETTIRFWRWPVNAQYGERTGEYEFALVDDGFLRVFDFDLIRGDPEIAFRFPNSVIVTEDTARHLFGDDDPMGRSFSVESTVFPGEYTVTGILKAPHPSSDLNFQILSTTVMPVGEVRDKWTMWQPMLSWRPVETFVLLKAGQDHKSLQTKMQSLIERFMGGEVATKSAFHLQPIHRVYLYGTSDFNPKDWGLIQRIYMLATIGMIVVVIACVNFTNLATARAVTRKREVGVRKVVGAQRPQLMVQFLGESLLLTGIALLIALALADISLPLFNQFAQSDLHIDVSIVAASAPEILALTVLAGLLAGAYPAFFLSSFLPVTVLTGGTFSSSGTARLKKGLVVFQFGTSILLVICTLVVYQQLRYIDTKDLGFARGHIVSLPIFSHDVFAEPDPKKRLSARHEIVKQVFLEHPNVLRASAVRYRIAGYAGRPRLIWPDGDRTRERTIRINEVDGSFFETFDVPVLLGRAFSADVASDTSQAIILNETAVRLLGWENDPIGRQIESPAFKDRVVTVIGVVRDYHALSLRAEIEPLGFIARSEFFYSLNLRIRPEGTAQTLVFLESQWKRFVPDEPFEYHFMDEFMEWNYFNEIRTGKMLGVFSLLAIFVACMGLFGLVAFMVQSRTKELGVRKVLGASTSHLVMLVSREFLLLVLLASAVAWPIAHYLMRDWLSGFAYRTSLNLVPFAVSTMLVLIIAFVTVSVQAVRAAQANPIDALRDE